MVGPMQRELARLSFEGKLQAAAEPVHFKGGDQGDPRERLPFGSWNAAVTWGTAQYGPSAGNPKAQGRALVAQLSENQFLVAGYFCTVDFFPAGTEKQRASQHIVEGTGQIPSALIDGKWQHRQFLRVEQGVYDNGVFKLIGSQNGDATDFGLKFGEEPLVLRVTLAAY